MEKRLTKGDKQRRAELRAQLSLEKADQQNSVNFSGSVSCLAAAGKQCGTNRHETFHKAW